MPRAEGAATGRVHVADPCGSAFAIAKPPISGVSSKPTTSKLQLRTDAAKPH
jgi:hypothetical protein